MKKLFLVMAAIALLCMGGIAHAVSYTVAGWGPTQYPGPVTPPAGSPHGADGYPGDTLELQTYTGTLDLTPGSYVQKINTRLWTIDYTYGGTATDPNAWSNLLFNVTAPRNISFSGGPTRSLSQAGLLECKWDNDYLEFYNGATTSLVVQGYKVDITPLARAREGGSNFSGGNPWVQPPRDIMARFDVAVAPVPAVPEPGTLALLACGAASVLPFARRRRKTS